MYCLLLFQATCFYIFVLFTRDHFKGTFYWLPLNGNQFVVDPTFLLILPKLKWNGWGRNHWLTKIKSIEDPKLQKMFSNTATVIHAWELKVLCIS